MSKKNRALSLLTALWLLACLAAPLVQAAQADTVTISSAADLLELSRRCALDTWSQNKTVILTADLDLAGEDFAPIPTFGGIFQGQGHTIGGLRITAPGSTIGLFRYIQPGAAVQDLTVKGQVLPQGTRSTVGGIVGNNAGTLQNCVFQGVVQGETAVGGIVGLNSVSGEVIGCTAAGTVGGENATGGVAGRNFGLLLKCENSAGVNLTESRPDWRAEETLEELAAAGEDSSRLLDGCTDTGGVVGWTGGVVQSCVNNGDVGYPHVGYNTGGVAGRQNGYLAGCVNNGNICGRKDVGGIVGQAEPYLLEGLGEDVLEELERELDTLDRLINKALDDAQSTGDSVSARLAAMGDRADDARDSAKRLLDRVGDFTDGTVGTVNLVMADITNALDQIDPALDDLSDVGGRLEDLSGRLGRAIGSLGDAVDAGGEVVARLRSSVSGLRQSHAKLNSAIYEMERALDAFRRFLNPGGGELSWESLEEARTELRQAFRSLRDAGDGIGDALAELERALSRSDELSGALGDALDGFQDVSSHASSIGTLLKSAFGAISGAVEDLTGDGPREFTPLGDEAREAGDSLFDALAGLSGEMEELNGALQSGGHAMVADLRAISRQFNVVFDVLIHALADLRNGVEAGPENVIQDTSDEDISATREGKVSGCTNTGAVVGDRNVGGVVGAVAIEVDLDPEDDITSKLSFGATYETKAVLQSCVNRGAVTAKKDCAGGLVGRMDLGTALDCQSYGPVTSTGGDYVGGIAGRADASIRGCFGKNVLSGGNYVGGIAGWASRLRDCRAIATIEEGTECLGAVAGSVGTDGILSGNLFVDTGWAGVDGVSYAGRAEPIPFEQLSGLPDVPAAFTAFSLTLMADGAFVAQIPFFYGDDLSRLDLPDVPEREDSYGVWPAFDLSGVRSDLTLEAVYRPWVTLAASEERDGKLSRALVDGRFTEDVVLRASDSAQTSPAEAEGDVYVWDVSLVGSKLGTGDQVPLRLLNPAGGNAVVWQYRDGRWSQTEAVRNGRYLLLTMTGTSGTFCIQPQAAAPWLMIAAAAAVVSLLIFALLRKFLGKKKAAKASNAAQSEEESEPDQLHR